MKNLNKTIYGKILIQAEEAKELGFSKLAESVLSAVESDVQNDNEEVTYSFAELEDHVKKNLWKVAVQFIAYHDLQSVDVQKVDEAISHLTKVVTAEMENAIDSNYKIGPLEPKLPGESK